MSFEDASIAEDLLASFLPTVTSLVAPTSSSGGSKRSKPVWQYFTITATYYYCNLCFIHKPFKLPASTTVAKNHLKSHHGTEYASIMSNNNVGKQKQTSLSQFTMPNDSLRKKTNRNQMSQMLSFGLLLAHPATSVNNLINPSFLSFCRELNPNVTIPQNYNDTKYILSQIASNIVLDAKKEMQAAKQISVTLNVRTDMTDIAFLGVTAHYVLNGSLKCRFLGVEEMKDSRSNVRLHLDKLLSKYDLTVDKNVFTVIVDGEGNMDKNFEDREPNNWLLPEDDYYDVDELLNLNVDDSDDFSITVGLTIPNKITCFAKTLQNCVSYACRETLLKSQAYMSMIDFVLKSWKIQSTKEELTRLGCNFFPSSSNFKLGVILDIIESFLKNSQLIENSILTNPTLFSGFQNLSAYNINLLDKYYQILKPFVDVINKVKCIGAILPYLSILETKIKGFQKLSQPFEIQNMLAILSQQMFQKFSDLKTDSRLLIATYLDPKFHISLTEDQIKQAESKISPFLPSNKNDANAISSALDFSASIDDCLIHMASASNSKTALSLFETYKALIKLAEYNDLEAFPFWHKAGTISEEMNYLSSVAFIYLSVPATSAPVEKVFSSAANSSRLHKNRISHTLLNDKLMVHLNSDLAYY